MLDLDLKILAHIQQSVGVCYFLWWVVLFPIFIVVTRLLLHTFCACLPIVCIVLRPCYCTCLVFGAYSSLSCSEIDCAG